MNNMVLTKVIAVTQKCNDCNRHEQVDDQTGCKGEANIFGREERSEQDGAVDGSLGTVLYGTFSDFVQIGSVFSYHYLITSNCAPVHPSGVCLLCGQQDGLTAAPQQSKRLAALCLCLAW